MYVMFEHGMLKACLNKIKLDKWDYILPLAAFLLAFALRYRFLATYNYPMMIHEQDAVGYMDVAKSFLHLRLPSVHGRPPGYPIVIALFALLPVGLEYAARLASVFMDAMIVFPLFCIARIYLSRVGAFVVCLLWAFFPVSLYFSRSPLSQSSYLCFLLIGAAALYPGLQKRDWRWFFYSGIFMALSYLTRPEGIVGFGYGFILCLTLLCDKNGFNRKNLLIPMCFLAGFILVAGPYLVAMRINLGGWTLSAASDVQVRGMDTVLTLNSKGELQKSVSTGLSVWKEYYKTFPSFIGAIQENIKGFVKVYVSTFSLFKNFVTVLGFLLLVWRSAWRNTALLLILFAVITPALVVNIPKTFSYIYPLYVMTFICFVYGLDALVMGCGTWIAKKLLPKAQPRSVKASLSVILLLPIIYIASTFYQSADTSFQEYFLVREAIETEKIFKGAGEIIKNNSQPNDVIMTRWGLVGYFADRPVVIIPKGGVREVIEYGRKNGIRFLLIDTKSVSSRRQELRELLGPLEWKPVNPEYGIEVFSLNYFPGIGGYVIYRYKNL